MDRINIQCLVEGQETELQFDKKAMPGETGLCFMITDNGCFKGYIAQERTGSCRAIGASHYSAADLQNIGRLLQKRLNS